MSSKYSSSLDMLIALALVLQTAYGANNALLYHFCSSSSNATTTNHAQYEANLNKLIAHLNYQTPTTGFGKATIGYKPNQVNGLALCRGDVSSSDCKTCLAEASSEILKRCPVSYHKAAIVWYDNCLLKYSDMDFFGQIDDKNKFYMWNVRSVSGPKEFNAQTNRLLGELAKEAEGEKELYADGDIEIGGNNKLYGLAQCTRDLTKYECRKCLDGIIGELPSCCDGKEGGRVVGGSCNFRYEIYPFVHHKHD